MWQALDVTIDYTVASAEQLSPQQTAERMKGMTHLQKLMLLRNVVKQSNRTDKLQMMKTISSLFASKRNEIAHSHLATSPNAVQFIYHGDNRGASACRLTFTNDEFALHVEKFVSACNRLHDAFCYDPHEMLDFVGKMTDPTFLASATTPRQTRLANSVAREKWHRAQDQLAPLAAQKPPGSAC